MENELNLTEFEFDTFHKVVDYFISEVNDRMDLKVVKMKILSTSTIEVTIKVYGTSKYILQVTLSVCKSVYFNDVTYRMRILEINTEDNSTTSDFNEAYSFDSKDREGLELIYKHVYRRFNQLVSTSNDPLFTVYLDGIRAGVKTNGYLQYTKDPDHEFDWDFSDISVATPVTMAKALELVNAYEEFYSLFEVEIKIHDHKIVIPVNLDKSDLPI